MTLGQFDDVRLYLNKWQMHLALTDAHIKYLHIPECRLLCHTTEDWMEEFPSWYIKPIDTWGGHSITKLEKQTGHWTANTIASETLRFDTTQQAMSYIHSIYVPSQTIVQREAPVAAFGQRPFDIRVLCQREETDAWLIAGWLARVGRVHGIVSNIGTGQGQVLTTHRLLVQLYQNEKLVRRVKHRIRRISLAICQVLDTYHPFDEVGIDFGLGTHGEVWLFEVNTNDRLGGPSHELFRHLPNPSLYKAIESRADARRHKWLEQFVNDLSHPTSESGHI